MSDESQITKSQVADSPSESGVNRRDAFRGLAAAAAVGVGSSAQAAEESCQARNPYGGGPNSGITLPPYYKPTSSIANANTFFPGVEDLGANEMRISFIGSTPVPPTLTQPARRSWSSSATANASSSTSGPAACAISWPCRCRCKWSTTSSSRIKDDIIALSNGCVCCTIRDDLLETVIKTIDRPEAPEYILLEASGVADPSGIAMTFLDPELWQRIRLDSITCVVDAEQIFAQPELPDLMALKLRQIAFSDMMILNKCDLAGPERMRQVRSWIDDQFSRLRIIEAAYCDVPLEFLLSVGRFDPARWGLEHDGCANENCRANAITISEATTRRPSARPAGLAAGCRQARGHFDAGHDETHPTGRSLVRITSRS
jgi:hypothetical protein